MADALNRYRSAVAYLESLSNCAGLFRYMAGKEGIDPQIFLDRMQWFLDALGNPEQGFKYVHVAGTAGKGTVSSLVHGMLERSGQKTGLFTSPFATTTLEKITVGGRYIDPELFSDLVEKIKPVLDKSLTDCPQGAPSYYEICFALALLAFHEGGCEWAVIEVGCGGTYDATNTIPAPEVAAITTIDFDHMHLLGNTLPEIASNKAGIIKKGAHVWTSEARPEIRDLFRTTSEHRAAFYHEISPEIVGYQERNKALARAIGDHLGISAEIQEAAIADFRLPARFELVQEHPRVIIDGAHNPAKVRAAVERLQKLSYTNLHVVIGMAEDKDAGAMLREIIPLATYCYYTRFQEPSRPALSPAVLQEVAGKLGELYLDAPQALEAALKTAKPEDLILVIGSFFLAGELRTRWFPEEWIVGNGRSF